MTVGVLAAETIERAEYLAGPARLAMLALRTGRRLALISPQDAAGHPDLATATAMPSNRVVGDAGLVAERLASLAERTDADELMISTMTHGLAERIDTLAIVADVNVPTVGDAQGRRIVRRRRRGAPDVDPIAGAGSGADGLPATKSLTQSIAGPTRVSHRAARAVARAALSGP